MQLPSNGSEQKNRGGGTANKWENNGAAQEEQVHLDKKNRGILCTIPILVSFLYIWNYFPKKQFEN